MKLTLDIRVPNFELLVVFLCMNCIYARRFADPSYYPQDYYDGQQRIEKIKTALSKLEHAPKWVSGWPDPSIEMGQVSGVALDTYGRLLVFHRGSHKWDENTFTDGNVYKELYQPEIETPTVLVFNKTGELVDKWGENLFFMPHGITVDNKGNVYVTDVALHQVFKFDAGNWKKPSLTLGERFTPGEAIGRFCKPSAVAVMPNGDFFVADGYCNHRILKMSPDGTVILHWGTSHANSPFGLNVPHALTLAEERGLVCVADRENGRVECFRADNGTFAARYSSWLMGSRLFSVAYAPVHGGRLYVVNGPSQGLAPVRGFVIDFASGRMIQTFAPDAGLSNPHDVVVSPDGSEVYVVELNPHRVYKFEDLSLRNASWGAAPAPARARGDGARGGGARGGGARGKPTATVELAVTVPPPSGWEWWWGAAGGAGGAGGAALLALAALALLRARNKGRKSVTRRRWEYGQGEFKLRRLLERRRFTRVHSDDSDEEPAPMLPQNPPANA